MKQSKLPYIISEEQYNKLSDAERENYVFVWMNGSEKPFVIKTRKAAWRKKG